MFRREGSGWSEWQRITSCLPLPGERFGWSLALDSDLLAISIFDDLQERYGKCLLYRLVDESWELFRVVDTGDANNVDEAFGQRLSIDGPILAASSEREDSPFVRVTGAAYLYNLTTCLDGTVSDEEETVDVLFLNGQASEEGYASVVEQGERLYGLILPPPSGGSGRYVIHANPGLATFDSESPLPQQIGTTCFPFLGASASPVAVWNNTGKVVAGENMYFGTPTSPPDLAPALFLWLDAGDPVHLPVGARVTFQGVILDPGSTSPRRASTTNAVVLVVE